MHTLITSLKYIDRVVNGSDLAKSISAYYRIRSLMDQIFFWTIHTLLFSYGSDLRFIDRPTGCYQKLQIMQPLQSVCFKEKCHWLIVMKENVESYRIETILYSTSKDKNWLYVKFPQAYYIKFLMHTLAQIIYIVNPFTWCSFLKHYVGRWRSGAEKAIIPIETYLGKIFFMQGDYHLIYSHQLSIVREVEYPWTSA